MPTANQGTINLLLPILPETQNPELFKELTRVYNAINLLASGFDTNNGTVNSSLESLLGVVVTQVATLDKIVKKLKAQVASLPPDYSAQFGDLRRVYYKYKVPNFHITNNLTVDVDAEIKGGILIHEDCYIVKKFACNGKTPQLPKVILTASAAPAGGVGTAAGGWDTAANRDLAITTINDLVLAVTRITDTLEECGIMKP